MFRHSFALIVLALAGCATTPKPMPTIVKVPVVEYVAVPAKLTEPCPITRAKERTVESVVVAYNANVTALEACNSQLTKIRTLSP